MQIVLEGVFLSQVLHSLGLSILYSGILLISGDRNREDHTVEAESEVVGRVCYTVDY